MRKLGWIMMCLLVLTGCSGPTLQRQTFTVELGQDIYANAAVYIKDAQNYPTDDWEVEAKSSGVVKTQNRFTSENMDYLVVGVYDFVIHAGNRDIDFSISVKDTQPPTILSCPTEIDISAGQSIDWSAYIKASDLSGVSFSTTSDFNASAAGSQDVSVRVSDRFGNAVTREVHVNVT